MASIPIWNGKDQNAHVCVRLSMKYSRGGTLFCAHPNYRQMGPRYDWVMIWWTKEGGLHNKSRLKEEDTCVHYGDDASMVNQLHMPPVRLLTLFSANSCGQPHLAFLKMCRLWCYVAIVPTVSYWYSPHTEILVLLTRHTKPLITLVNVNAIACHCLIIPENKDVHGSHEVWSRESWADEFHSTYLLIFYFI
jgi:hypothetical protein